MLLYQVLHDEPRPPRRLNDRIPRDLETICLKAMAKEPHRRYPTCRELAEDLRSFLKGEPIRARPVGRMERLARWCRRNPALATAGGLAAVALLAVTVVSVLFALHKADAAATLARTNTELDREKQNAEDAFKDSQENFRKLGETHGELVKTDGERRQVLEQSARLTFNRGLALCEEGEVARGMLWLGRSLEIAGKAEADDLERAIRANLAGWRYQLTGLRAVLPNSRAYVGHQVDFSPDGKILLTRPDENTAQLWDAATGLPIGEPLRDEKRISAVAFSPDSKLVATVAGNHTVRLWHAATGKPHGEPLHREGVQKVVFSPDGKTILTAGPGAVFTPDGKVISNADRKDAVGVPFVYGTDLSTDGKIAMTYTSKEVRLWDATTAQSIGKLPVGEQGIILRPIFSPDGKVVLTKTLKGEVQLWDTATAKSLGTLVGHQGYVNAEAFSPDGKVLLTTAADHTARFWEAATGRPLGPPLQHPQGKLVHHPAFSPDGTKAFTVSGQSSDRYEVYFWEVGTGRPLLESIRSKYVALGPFGAPGWHFSPDGKIILTVTEAGGKAEIRLWEASTEKPLGEPLPHPARVLAVAFSPDGKVLLTGGEDKAARLWETATGKPLGSPLPHPGPVAAVAFSPDGQTIRTSGGEAAVRLWDVPGNPQRIGGPVRLPGLLFGGASFSPDGKTLWARGPGQLWRWHAATGQSLGAPLPPQLLGRALAEHMVLGRDAKTILTFTRQTVLQVRDAATGKPGVVPLTVPGETRELVFSPDGKTLLTRSDLVRREGAEVRGSLGDEMRLWDLATGNALGEPLRSADAPAFANVTVAFGPEGRVLVAQRSGPSSVQLRDIRSGKPVGQLLPHRGTVHCAAFSPDGKTLLTGSAAPDGKGEARLWESSTGEPLGEPLAHDAAVYNVAYAPDGKTILTRGAGANKIWLWDVATRQPIGEPLQHPRGTRVAVFSPDSKVIATVGWDSTARLWDTATGKPLGEPLQHKQGVTAIAFSPDGKMVLTGSSTLDVPSKGEVRLWDQATGKPLCEPLPHDRPVTAVAFSPDGKTFRTGREVPLQWQLWETATAKPVDPSALALPELRTAAWSPDGKILVTETRGYRIQLWEADTGKLLQGPVSCPCLAPGTTVPAFGPDFKTFLTANGREAQLWETATGKPIGQPLVHPARVIEGAFSPDGGLLLTLSGRPGFGDKVAEVCLWNAVTGQPVGEPLWRGEMNVNELPRQGLPLARFSPDGRIVLTATTSRGQTEIRFWDAATGKALREPLRHPLPFSTLRFSPDGKVFAVVFRSQSIDRGEVRCWELETGKPVGQSLIHPQLVQEVAFSRDGRTLLTASDRGRMKNAEARLWDLSTGKLLGKPLAHGEGVHSVTFSPDGKTIATTESSPPTAHLWHVPLPLEGSVERIILWTQVLTGTELDADGVAHVLDVATWQQRRQRLRELGGPPLP